MKDFNSDVIDAVVSDLKAQSPIRKGYRLRRLEVKNFGGYHGPASVFNLDMKGAVFSGDNGAGKSTAIDAYRMLWRMHPRFNSATQEQTKDRTVETYYMGQHGKTDTGSGVKIEKLRDFGIKKGFLAVCGVFETDTGQIFSILRMGYIEKKGVPVDWRLITAHADISIERDFPIWTTKGAASRAAEVLGGELHANFKDFFAHIGMAFGIDNPEEATAAFRFLDESIGVKKMASITGFARDNIFPKTSLRDSADSVITTFEKVRESIATVQRCKDKIAGLKEVARKFGFLDKALATHEESVSRRARFEQFSATIEHAYWGRQFRKARDAQVMLEAELLKAETLEATAKAEVQAIDEAIRSQNFDKIDQYIADKEEKEAELIKVASRVKTLKAEYLAVGLNFRCAVETELTAARKDVADTIVDLDKRRANVADGRRELERTLHTAENDKITATDAYTSLLRSKSAIDEKLLKARKAIAEALHLREDDIPFLAELVQIRDGEEAWEGTANRVLGGLGCEILIDAAYASEARGIVNRGPNNAGKKGWNARVVLREISDMAPKTRTRIAQTTLAGKLEIRDDSAFTQVARALVDDAAAHDCVTEAKFKTATGDACTKEGSVKKGSRIVKDDRSAIDDRSKYVLGWNVQDRIDLAETAMKTAQKAYTAAEDAIASSEAAALSLHKTGLLLSRLDGKDVTFDQVNQAGLVQDIESLRAQIAILDNPEAEKLRRAKAKSEKTESDARTRQKLIQGQIGGKSSSKATAETNRNAKADRLKVSIATFGAATHADREAYRRAAREAMKATDKQAIGQHILTTVLYDLSGVISDIRKVVDSATNSEMNIGNRGAEAKRAAEAFLRDFTEEGSFVEIEGMLGDLSKAESLAAARMVRDTWAGRLNTLEVGDLPRHEQAFKDSQKSFAKSTIETIETAQNAYATRLKKMQDGLNAILKGLVYDPMEGTRARLRIRPSQDCDEVSKFRARLSHAISNLYAEPEIVEKNTEAVIELINDETTKEGHARREAILNLPNWFEMDIEEYHADENGEFISQRRFWSGRDGESGGQGERLTMLLIGAGLAYTFGAHDETRANAGLQTIVLDEAFMHGSEEMAAAATDVLNAIGLQVVAATPVQKLMAFAGHADRIFDISKRNEQIRHVVSNYAQMATDSATASAEAAKTAAERIASEQVEG
ncbi:SbcC/MukB-like Walker B domain-containing protein [Loktanella sp. DJP18]|uniref:SbcC/MukB-like Walker B domain-containing protein n=1 Tax=Loktanella sp. DJP18 TaxID=3409788 RepID=UPI003BB6403A